jgi:hypothetical protein
VGAFKSHWWYPLASVECAGSDFGIDSTATKVEYNLWCSRIVSQVYMFSATALKQSGVPCGGVSRPSAPITNFILMSVHLLSSSLQVFLYFEGPVISFKSSSVPQVHTNLPTTLHIISRDFILLFELSA